MSEQSPSGGNGKNLLIVQINSQTMLNYSQLRHNIGRPLVKLMHDDRSRGRYSVNSNKLKSVNVGSNRNKTTSSCCSDETKKLQKSLGGRNEIWRIIQRPIRMAAATVPVVEGVQLVEAAHTPAPIHMPDETSMAEATDLSIRCTTRR